MPGYRLPLAPPQCSPEIAWALDTPGRPPHTESIALSELLPIQVRTHVELLQVLAVCEGVALLIKGQSGVSAVLSEHLSNGPPVAVFRLHLQGDCAADWEKSLQRLPGLLSVRSLRRLWGIDAGHSDREVLAAIRDPQRVAITE